jgi:hypothetical protein
MSQSSCGEEDSYLYSSDDGGGQEEDVLHTDELEAGSNDEDETPQYMSGSESSCYVVDYRDLDEMSGSADSQVVTRSTEDQDYVVIETAKPAKPFTQEKPPKILSFSRKKHKLDGLSPRQAQNDSSEADIAAHKRNHACGIRMMDLTELQSEMKRQIQEVSDILPSVPCEAIALLLQKCHWSNELLLERYMGDTDRFLREAGVFRRCSLVSVGDLRHDVSVITLDEAIRPCLVCYEQLPFHEMHRMPCNHVFCRKCWMDYLCNAINQFGSACVYQTTCPDSSCTEKVTELEFGIALVKTVVSPNPVAEDIIKPRRELDQFYRSSVLEYVKSNPLAQYCPGHGCDRVALAKSYDALQLVGGLATCDQCCPRLTFCVHCAHFEPHAPASCQQVRLWKQKCRDIPASRNWVLDGYISRHLEEGFDVINAHVENLRQSTIDRCNMFFGRPDTYVQGQLKDFEFENKDDWETAKWFLINTKSCPRCLCPAQQTNGAFGDSERRQFRHIPCLTPLFFDLPH